MARHGRLRRSKPVVALLAVVGIVCAVAVVSAGSVVAIAAVQVTHDAKPTVHLNIAAPPGHTASPIPKVSAASGEVNLLLVSTDTRKGQGPMFADPADQEASSGVGNNDVNLLIHIPDDHRSMEVISIPRDLELPIPACQNDSGRTTPATSFAMMNTALSRGGEKTGLSCAAAAVSQLTGLQVNYAALITFLGTIAMSDAIGGVSVCLATPVVDRDTTPALNLQPGTVNLVGAQAMAFLRSRHGVGDSSDLGRISNQQTFMSAMMRQIVAGGVLDNPLKLFPLADATAKNLTLSDTLNPTTLVQIGLAMKGIGLPNIVFLQYPVVSDPENPNRVIVNPVAARTLNALLKTDQPIQLSPGSLGRAAVVAPGSTPAPAAPTPSADTPTPSSSAAPGAASAAPSPTSSAAVLPPSVSGQSASEVTCASKKAGR